MKDPKVCSKCGETPSVVKTRGIPMQYQIKCYNCQNATPFFLSESEAVKTWNGKMAKSMSSKFVG